MNSPICLEVKTLDGNLLPSNGQEGKLHPIFHWSMSPDDESNPPISGLNVHVNYNVM